MRNPYTVLGISQNATNQEIIVSVAKAMKNRIFSTREVAEARAILAKPSSRLAADFTFPIFPQREKISLIVPTLKSTGISIDSINPNKYDSL